MANDDSLLVDISDGVATVTFNRPHRLNAMNSEMLTDLVPNLWPKLQKDKAVRVVILTGAGDRAFSSGLDVKEAAQTPPSTRRGSRSNLGLTPRSQGFTKPFITAVNGLCGGVGLAFIADSDITIMAEGAYLFNPGATIGQLALYAPITWAHWVPFQSLMRMVMVGNKERIMAQQAKELGMVTEVVPLNELMARAREVAGMIAYNSPTAVRLAKKALWEALDLGLRPSHTYVQKMLSDYSGHPDSIEGPKALVEKRVPNWAELED